MTPQATTVHRATRALDVARDWLKSPRHEAWVAAVLYAVIAMGFFGQHVLAHLGRDCACQPGATDPSIFMWSLAWWPHALLHGLNPFVTHAVFAPDSTDLGAMTSVPAAALVMAPVTLLFGPLVSYNLAVIASPLLAAFFGFLLCRYITRSFAAALVGGYLFGFSPYMLGQMLGHLHLVLVFPIPAAVHLTLRLIDGRIGQRRFIALMVILLAALLGFSTEVAFTFVLVSGVALIAAFALAPAIRPRLLSAAKAIVIAGALAALVASPLIYYGLSGIVKFPPTIGDIDGGDALGFLVPTVVIRLGRQYFGAVAAGFTGGDVAESGIYLGIPLALVVAPLLHHALGPGCNTNLGRAAGRDRRVAARLAPAYRRAPHDPAPLETDRPLAPARGRAVRLALYMFLIVAVIAAMWLAQPRAGRLGVAKWAVAAIGVAFVAPNLSAGLWHGRPPNPPFFTTMQYRRVLSRDETVLVLPFGPSGMSMLWQAETGMWFRMAGGYLNQYPPPDYVRDPLLSALAGQIKPSPVLLRSFLSRRHVGAVIVDPSNPQQWPSALAGLGLKPVSLGGVWVYRV